MFSFILVTRFYVFCFNSQCFYVLASSTAKDKQKDEIDLDA